MKKIILSALLIVLIVSPLAASAKSKEYMYRSRANWVKLIKLSNKQLAGVKLKHPADITEPKMESMLLSLNMTKASIFKKDVKTTEVFSIDEAKKFAPYITEALRQAEPNQVVNLAIVHKRPYFVVRKDYMSMINVFATEDGVHFYFSKLFAKLDGDYQQASKMDTAINKAKSIHVSIDANTGQKIADGSADELVLDPHYDFVSNTNRTVVAETKYIPQGDVVAIKSSKKDKQSVSKNTSATMLDVSTRLQELMELKTKKLITDAEYNQKKKEILSEI